MNAKNKIVQIYDDFLDININNDIEYYFKNTEWKYYNKSIISMWNETIPHWSRYFYINSDGTHINNVIFDVPCIQKLYEKIIQGLDQSYYLLRCYANAHTYGNDGNIHIDDKRDNTKTFIFYPMTEWKVDWGGETIFWDRNTREIVQSIIPKSNRLIEFDSNIWHGPRPISRYCTNLRTTLMFKFKKI